jgi:hypothetical protein
VDDLTEEFRRHSLTEEPAIVEDEEPLNLNGNGTKPKPEKPEEEKKKKPPPTMFHEPDANSLLDSFGF